MWVKFLNIMKHVWRNPVVQFACFTLLDWVTFMFHRSTKHKFNKKKKYDGCSQDYSIGTSHKKTPKFNPKKKSSTTKVEVEQQKSIRKQPKKVVDKVEEPQPVKRRRAVRRKTATTETKVTKRRSSKKKTSEK